MTPSAIMMTSAAVSPAMAGTLTVTDDTVEADGGMREDKVIVDVGPAFEDDRGVAVEATTNVGAGVDGTGGVIFVVEVAMGMNDDEDDDIRVDD